MTVSIHADRPPSTTVDEVVRCSTASVKQPQFVESKVVSRTARTSHIDAQWGPIPALAAPTGQPLRGDCDLIRNVEGDTDTTALRGITEVIRRNRGRVLIGIAAALSLTLLQTSNTVAGGVKPAAPEYSTHLGNVVFSPSGQSRPNQPEQEQAEATHVTTASASEMHRPRSFSRKSGHSPWRTAERQPPLAPSSRPSRAAKEPRTRGMLQLEGPLQRHGGTYDSHPPL